MRNGRRIRCAVSATARTAASRIPNVAPTAYPPSTSLKVCSKLGQRRPEATSPSNASSTPRGSLTNCRSIHRPDTKPQPPRNSASTTARPRATAARRVVSRTRVSSAARRRSAASCGTATLTALLPPASFHELLRRRRRWRLRGEQAVFIRFSGERYDPRLAAAVHHSPHPPRVGVRTVVPVVRRAALRPEKRARRAGLCHIAQVVQLQGGHEVTDRVPRKGLDAVTDRIGLGRRHPELIGRANDAQTELHCVLQVR